MFKFWTFYNRTLSYTRDAQPSEYECWIGTTEPLKTGIWKQMQHEKTDVGVKGGRDTLMLVKYKSYIIILYWWLSSSQ